MVYKIIFSVSLGLLLTLAQPVLAKTDVVLSPPSVQLAIGQSTNIEIRLDSTVKILGADLVLKYDPNAITVDKIEIGNFWQKPQVLINKIDATNGKVYFSAFSYPVNLGSGNLAIVSIRQNNSTGSTILLDNQSLFAGENGQKIIYTNQKTTVSATGQTPTQVPTSSPIPIPSPTNFQLGLTVTPKTTQPAVEISAQVVTGSPTAEIGPTILLEQSPTPIVKAKPSTGFTLQLVALFLLIFGTLLFFTFKKNL